VIISFKQIRPEGRCSLIQSPAFAKITQGSDLETLSWQTKNNLAFILSKYYGGEVFSWLQPILFPIHIKAPILAE
jgi:hypothetical protein